MAGRLGNSDNSSATPRQADGKHPANSTRTPPDPQDRAHAGAYASQYPGVQESEGKHAEHLYYHQHQHARAYRRRACGITNTNKLTGAHACHGGHASIYAACAFRQRSPGTPRAADQPNGDAPQRRLGLPPKPLDLNNRSTDTKTSVSLGIPLLQDAAAC